MSVRVRIPAFLQECTGGREVIEGRAGTLADLIADLDRQYPGLGDRILEHGGVRAFLHVFVNDDGVVEPKAAHTTLKDGDEVMILPAIAGG
ncbi:MAG TPA: MoaD/ThiS family protein [Dissulfurispiraceae bacterium]|nr:MoaD/ThiS family protein [Dissulfurispiraceae bacterium]